MKFDKNRVAYMFSFENIGRKEVLKSIYNLNLVSNYSKEVKEYELELKKKDISVISCFENIYPSLLKNIYDYPLVLFTIGDIKLLARSMVTFVGTRNMSEYGKWCVTYFLNSIKHLDVVVVSGLARGVDGFVHKECLRLGLDTVAVVAGGIDIGFPKSNKYLYDEISKKGLIISEFPPKRKVVKGMFPYRNRILAGLSLVTVVIESSERGGSLITAQLALEYGRDVFCVPCNINKFTSQGCNMLIEQGANPLFSDSQIVETVEKHIGSLYKEVGA